ncbi:hypothetical protein CCR85_13425 [Rhodothalassium salexigens]|nr:hypothetical protein [Rhodothalassium salexigens]MBK5919728.1 hypothetical protein [Rhodothalassium salexigens]
MYPHPACVANDWAYRLKDETRWPDQLELFLGICHRAGQVRPTFKVHQGGHILSVAVTIAVGVNTDGYREVLPGRPAP